MPDTPLPTFVVRLDGAPGVGRTALAAALQEVPVATDDELARWTVLDTADATAPCDAVVHVVRGAPPPGALAETYVGPVPVMVAVHARDLDPTADGDESVRAAWSAVVDPTRVHLTATPPGEGPRGVDVLRGALLDVALATVHVPVARARRARRPLALGIIAGAAMVTAAEGMLPGAAGFIVATQAGAISSLHYLYTGRWMARSQALALLPAFAAEAAGGSVFLLVKSFLPPTGVADVLAAGVAASMTVSVLGTVAVALDAGYSLEETERLKETFKKLRARTRAERKTVAAARHRWRDKAFWTDLARRVVFP